MPAAIRRPIRVCRHWSRHPPDQPAWNGPYFNPASGLIDPWGHPYLYKSPGTHGEVDVWTLGSDNAEGGTGGARDVGNW